MARILIVYWTTDGQTRRICERLREVIEPRGHEVALASLRDGASPDPGDYDKVVVGASIRYGRHHQVVFDYIERHLQALQSRPNAFFSVNVVARKPEKNTPQTNPYLQKFLKRIRWQPRHLGVFAGKLDYPKYDFLDRNVIRFIMWMTKGPTDPQAVVEFTDWGKVEEFGALIGAM